MKKIILGILFIIFIFTLTTGCNNSETKTTTKESNEKKETILDLTGTWKQSNSNSNDSYFEATIENDVIEINIISEDSKALYWSGSYEKPTSSGKQYKWTSNANKEKLESSLFGSTDDTKDFNYSNNILSYEASMMGTTTTIKMEKK